MIRTTYFEREYLPGIATDKMPWKKYGVAGYADESGETAGTGGRVQHHRGPRARSGQPSRYSMTATKSCAKERTGCPTEILVGDHSGAFGEYKAAAGDLRRPLRAPGQ